MKKSRMVLWMFSILVAFFSHTALSKDIALSNEVGAVDLDRLEAATKQRPDFFRLNEVQSFRARFESGFTYFLASSTMLRDNPNFHGNGYPGGRGWCEFDFFDSNYRYVNGIRVTIRDHGDTNVCNWIEGVSAVTYKGQPGLLATVQYHRGIEPAKTVDQIGNNYHDFTALLVLKPNPDGSLSIHQDDSCLGGNNQIDTLAVARKRLAECSQ
jgi:hypothetical protein